MSHRLVDIDLFAGQPVPAVDPLPVLTRLLSAGCRTTDNIGAICHYCRREEYATGIEHAPGCPYVEAVTLFGDPNATDAPRGVLNP